MSMPWFGGSLWPSECAVHSASCRTLFGSSVIPGGRTYHGRSRHWLWVAFWFGHSRALHRQLKLFRWVSLHYMCPGKTPLDLCACSPSLPLRAKAGETQLLSWLPGCPGFSIEPHQCVHGLPSLTLQALHQQHQQQEAQPCPPPGPGAALHCCKALCSAASGCTGPGPAD